MRSACSLAQLLKTGGFTAHARLGRIVGVRFCVQVNLIAVATAIILLIGSFLDHTLFMTGRDVGLLRHPTIWTFLLLQIALPLSIWISFRNLIRARSSIRKITRSRRGVRDQIIRPLTSFINLADLESRAAGTALYCVGILAFAWNTIQNQLPRFFLARDFWDSSNHHWGFWITRVYKLYLFGWLFPYIALVYFGIVIVVVRMIRRARMSGNIQLEPFHPDGVGGLGFVGPLITTPIIVALLLGSVSTAAAAEVHRGFDITPLIGVAVVICCALAAYCVPALFLRTDIIALKHEALKRITQIQQTYYGAVVNSQTADAESLRKAREAIDYFEKVNTKIRSIPDMPHFSRLIRYAGLALTPSVLSIAFRLFDTLRPFLQSLPRTP